jgi:DNA invertase Pin-like site-specific DNA recombinase
MRAAIYARYSTDLQSEASIDDQVRQCERAARAAGFATVAHFEDRGISGGTTSRPGYQALLSAARAGQIEVVVTEDISRLWRNRSEFGQRSAELEDLGIHLLTCAGDDTRRDGWGLMAAIKAAIAEHYRREISYRTRRGLEGRALAGKPTGGTLGYGYRPDGSIDPVCASRVRQIHAWAAAGWTRRAIADLLNQGGIAAPRGGLWGQSTVSALLANPRYRGEVVWGKTETKRSAADSGRQRAVKRPEPLVRRAAPELAIV